MTMIPTRLLQAVRPSAAPGVLAAAATVAATFAATPIILPALAEAFAVPLGTTGLTSAAQVSSFALASFLSGRFFRPSKTLHYASLGLIAVASTASAFAPGFTFLVATRFLAGIGLGTLTWIAWSDASRFVRGIGEVAAVAPLTAAVASPAIGWVVELAGHRGVYLGLAATALLAAWLPVDLADLPRIGRTVSKSRSNRVLLAALAVLSTGGSAVFIFVGASAVEFHSLQPATVAWGLTLNALTGVAATRITARTGHAPIWLVATALSALTVGTIASDIALFAALALWGFAFWMAVPAVFKLLADASLAPHERTGDAQAVMAVGRVAGPLVGAIALEVSGFAGLSLVGAGIVLVSAALVLGVERHRRAAARLGAPA